MREDGTFSGFEQKSGVMSLPPDPPHVIMSLFLKICCPNNGGNLIPRQNGQANYLEVWVEKDALSGVLKRVTEKYHVPILVNRGYSSASAMFDSYQRFKKANDRGQAIKILYLGDYDPSGVDMIRDIKDRTVEFIMGDYGYETEYLALKNFSFSIVPIALTKQQIEEYNPPPNQAKRADTRAKDFIEKHGDTSWEVDALRPEILNELLDNAIRDNIDETVYQKIIDKEEVGREKLRSLIKLCG